MQGLICLVIYMDLYNSSMLPFTPQLRIVASVSILALPLPNQHCHDINIHMTFTNQIIGSKK